ncbi:hypothetical protein PkP19E3_32860 (plasmid) [Pseudomonas koreensis]|nr:hypothetical protein PkP19E3_32860 [Pseudomonas koreensis]
MTTVVLCEKPTQSKVHASLFGIAESGAGYHKAKNGWIFTHSIGHMVEMVEPGDLEPRWKNWDLENLPIIPKTWKMAAYKDKAEQLKTVLRLLKSADEIIIATDCGREGELIGRELIDLSGNSKYRLLRFWSSSLDEASLRAAWNKLRDGREFDTLHQAALVRSRFDYMWGMTNSRGATLTFAPSGTVFPIGRVQTPVLNLVVIRHLAIVNFTPQVFFTLAALVNTSAGDVVMTFAPKGHEHRLWEKSKADALAASIQGTRGQLAVESNDKRESPPKFPSQSDLQKECSRRWKWTLDHTLDIGQSLYDAKYISYPRTGCNLMPEEQIPDVPGILTGLEGAGWVPSLSITGTPTPIYRKDRIQPDSEIQKNFDHHAILPTTSIPTGLSGDEKLLYQLIVLYYIRALSPDYEYNQVDATLPAGGILLKASGVTPLKLGFKALEPKAAESTQDDSDKGTKQLPPLTDGMDALVQRVDVKQGVTKAPPYYTEGTLLDDMINVHKFVTAPEQRARLKETSGLGTEATRANMVKELRNRKLIIPGPKKGDIDCSEKSLLLIQSIPDILKDPGQTAIWEDYMDHVRFKRITFEDAMGAANNAVERCALFYKQKGMNQERADAMKPIFEFNGFATNCPTCSKPMAYLKNGKFGPYWACSDRECKTSLKAAQDGKPIPKADAVVGELCEKCKKKHLVLRQSSKGPFWACSGFPKCKHTAKFEA